MLSYFVIRIGDICFADVWNAGSFRGAVIILEEPFKPRPGRLRHVLWYVRVNRKIDIFFFRIQIKELLWSVPGQVRLVETYGKEERVIANVLKSLDEVVRVGHIPQGDILQLLLGVGPPGHIIDVSCCSVENLLRPRSWIVVLLVTIGLSWVEYLSSSFCHISILFEVLRHRNCVWKIVPEHMVVVIASDGVWPPSSQE